MVDVPKVLLYQGYEIQKKMIEHTIWNLYSTQELQWKEGEYSQVYFLEDDSKSADLMIRLADTYYTIISSDFNYKSDKKVQFLLYNDKKLMAKALKTENEDKIPMGAYYGGVIHVLEPKLWTSQKNEWEITEDFLQNGPIIHEMIHFFIDEKMHGDYPLWFTEGVALYYENKYTGYEWRKDLKEKSKLITVEDLKNRFTYLDVGIAYRKSYDIICGIVDKVGEKGLQEIIENHSLTK